MTLDSPRGWVNPSAAGSPALDIFGPWPPSTESTVEPPTGRWEVVTESSRYLLDLHRCTASRRSLDVAELALGSLPVVLRGDTEELTLLAVIECRIGRPMLLLLNVEPGGHVGTVRMTSNVRSCRPVTP